MLSVTPRNRDASPGRSPPVSRPSSAYEIYDVTFSETCGENILLSESMKEAEWNLRYSGAIALLEQSILKGEIIQLEFEGSGHVEIGLTRQSPMSIQNLHTSVDKQIILVNEIKLHKDKCLLTIKIKTGRTRAAISLSVGTKMQHNEIMIDTDAWLAVNLKFGNVVCNIVEPSSREFKFHSNSGDNVNFIDSDKRTFKMKNENPATRCGCTVPQGQEVHMEVETVTDSNQDLSREPPQFSLKLGLRDQDIASKNKRGSGRSARALSARSNLSSHSPTRNERNSGRLSGDIRSNNYTILQVFDRENCKGNLTISFQRNGNIMYVHSSGKSYQGEVKDVDPKYGAIFILFRIKLKILNTTKGKIYDGLEMRDADNLFETVTYARPNISNIKSFVEFIPKIAKELIKM